MQLNRTKNELDREARNNENQNWEKIEKMADDISGKAFDQLVDKAKLIWKEPVNTFEDLPSNAEIGETRQIRSTGKVYRWDGTDWNEIQQIDAGPVNEVDTRLTNKITTVQNEIENARVSHTGTNYNNLKERLDKEHQEVTSQLAQNKEYVDTEFEQRAINVKWFGAKGDGVTDDTEAFIQALGEGNRSIWIPEGVYRVSGISVPSHTTLVGSGKNKTIIKLLDDTPVENSVLTNNDWINGNENIYIAHLTLDWNKDTRPEGWVIPAGPTSSCLLFANVKDSFVEHVYAKDGGLHGFDITSPEYNRESGVNDPEYYQPNGSENVKIANCYASGAGDDNFTTHFSRNITFSHCYSFNPKGINAGASNTNCFEIDDGSVDIMLDNCIAVGGVRGFEIKGHHHSPAAKRVQLVNCRSIDCSIGFDIRHIGFSVSTDPISETAHDVQLVNCQAVNPRPHPELNESVGLHALRIQSYDSVNVVNFEAICEDTSIQYGQHAIVSVFYKGRLTNLQNITIRGFQTANNDLYIVGGSNSVGKCIINGVTIIDSGKIGIAFGSGMDNCQLSGAIIERNSPLEGSIGVFSSSPDLNISQVSVLGYETPFSIGGVDSTTDIFKHKGVAIIGSGESHVTSTNGFVIGSLRGRATGANQSGVINSYNTINPESDSTVWGWGTGSTPTTSNRKVEISARNGTVKATGAITGSSSFTDYAEYFESVDGKPIETGVIVSLIGDKIKPADGGDMLGVITETAGVVLGESSFAWQGRFKRNEFGGLIYKEVDYEGERILIPVESDEYNEKQEYIPRNNRPEWNIVALLGQVYVRVDETVRAGDCIQAKNGIGTKSEVGWKVMKITTDFDESKGYGVALCFIR